MAIFKNEKLEMITLHKIDLLDELIKITTTLRYSVRDALESSKSTTTWRGARELQEVFDQLKAKEDHYRHLESEARIESDLHDYVNHAYLGRLRDVVTKELGLECTDETMNSLARRLIAEKRIQSPQAITKEVLLDLGLIPAMSPTKPPKKAAA